MSNISGAHRVTQTEAIAGIVSGVTENVPYNIALGGPSGSGKTTLYKKVEAELLSLGLFRGEDFEYISMEDLYEGWSGLDTGSELLAKLLIHKAEILGQVCSVGHTIDSSKEPISVNFLAWDWLRSQRVTPRQLNPMLPWIIEGCGSLSMRSSSFLYMKFWMSRPFFHRLFAVIRRDGLNLWYWLHWERDYRKHTKRASEVIESATFID